MSVDKFGRLPRDAPNVIHVTPIQKYDYTLDELENVEGFNREGIRDGVYGFRLDHRGLYNREEIKSVHTLNDLTNVEGFSDAGPKNVVFGFKLKPNGIYQREKIEQSGFLVDTKLKDQPLMFAFTENKWVPIPHKYNWDIDIVMTMDKIRTKGENHIILNMRNSGSMFGGYKPLKLYEDRAELHRLETEPAILAVGFIKNRSPDLEKSGAVIQFQTEFFDDESIVKTPDVGATIIVEGHILQTSADFQTLMEGLKIKCLKTGKFVIIIKKTEKLSESTQEKFEVQTHTDQIAYQVEPPVSLAQITIFKEYLITRLRFTNRPVSLDEIKFL